MHPKENNMKDKENGEERNIQKKKKKKPRNH